MKKNYLFKIITFTFENNKMEDIIKIKES